MMCEALLHSFNPAAWQLTWLPAAFLWLPALRCSQLPVTGCLNSTFIKLLQAQKESFMDQDKRHTHVVVGKRWQDVSIFSKKKKVSRMYLESRCVFIVALLAGAVFYVVLWFEASTGQNKILTGLKSTKISFRWRRVLTSDLKMCSNAPESLFFWSLLPPGGQHTNYNPALHSTAGINLFME